MQPTIDGRVAEAAERLKTGFTYAQCPDHWQECNDARTLAEAFLAARADAQPAQSEAEQPQPVEGAGELPGEPRQRDESDWHDVPNEPGVWYRLGDWWWVESINPPWVTIRRWCAADADCDAVFSCHLTGLPSEAWQLVAPKGKWKREPLKEIVDGVMDALDCDEGDDIVKAANDSYAFNDRMLLEASKLRNRAEAAESTLAAALADNERLKAACAAYRGLVENELGWEDFRSEFASDGTASGNNAKKLRDWLAEHGLLTAGDEILANNARLTAELERVSGERDAKPNRCYELIVKVGGDTWPDVERLFAELAIDVGESGGNCRTIIAGGSGSGSVEIKHDPAITHDSYFQSLEATLAQAAAEGGRDA